MRLVLTVGLYLVYIRNFCDYLLTGKVDYQPTNPAGMLGHASTLDQVLARPDGLFLCALFAGGCFGVASFLVKSMRDVDAFLFHMPTHVDYDLGTWPKGHLREGLIARPSQDSVTKQGPAADDASAAKNATKSDRAPDQPPK